MISISTSISGHAGPSGSSSVPDEHFRTLIQALNILLAGMRDHQG